MALHATRALLAFGMFLSSLPPVSAHSELRGSMPSAHARLEGAPTEIVLNFKERVQVTTLRLLDPASRVIRLTIDVDLAPSHEKRAVVPADLKPGHYKIDWAAISSDGHPVSGTVPFEVRLPGGR